jgi:aspartate dehydrogenase
MSHARGHQPLRVAVLGRGAIGGRVLASLQASIAPDAALATLCRAAPVGRCEAPSGVGVFSDPAELERWRPHIAIECAGHEVVAHVVPRLLACGTDVLLASVGALADSALRDEIADASRSGRGRLLTVAGAIGGLDALAAARVNGLTSVAYTGRKPPAAWQGTPAEQVCDLQTLASPLEIFSGSAGLSAKLYPKNANVTAAVALAGIGFDRTTVKLIADPMISTNVHELEAYGPFGRLFVQLENRPLPDNPRTSILAVLSIEAELRRWIEQRRTTSGARNRTSYSSPA